MHELAAQRALVVFWNKSKSDESVLRVSCPWTSFLCLRKCPGWNGWRSPVHLCRGPPPHFTRLCAAGACMGWGVQEGVIDTGFLRVGLSHLIPPVPSHPRPHGRTCTLHTAFVPIACLAARSLALTLTWNTVTKSSPSLLDSFPCHISIPQL